MLRIELTRGDETFVLDTKQVSMQLNFQESDIRDITSRKAAHSLAFKLPVSNTNNSALQFVNVVDAEVDARVRHDVLVFDGGMKVFNGWLSVRSCDLQAQEYDCVVYSKEAGIGQLLKTARWPDVFTLSNGDLTTVLDHDLTPATIKAAQAAGSDITDGDVGANIILYPAQYAAFVNAYAGEQFVPNIQYYYTASAGATARRNPASNYMMAIQVRYLLVQLFAFLGYELDVTTENDVFAGSNSLIPSTLCMVIPRDQYKFRPYFSTLQFGVELLQSSGNTSGNTYLTNSPVNDPLFTWMTWATGTQGYDPDGFFGSNAQYGALVSPITGVFNFTMTLAYSFDAAPTNGHYIGVRPFDVFDAQFSDNYAVVTQTSLESVQFAQVSFQVDVTDLSQLWVFPLVFSLPNGTTTLTLFPNFCSLRMTSYVGLSPKVQVPSTLDNGETLDKFLQAIMTQFNLVLSLDNEAKTARFDERRNFYEQNVANSKDWTKKVDKSKSIVLTSNLESLNKSILFQDADGTDGQSLYTQDVDNQKFTNFTYRSGVEYAAGEQTIGGYFAPARYSRPYANESITDLAANSVSGIHSYKRLPNTSPSNAETTTNKRPLLVTINTSATSVDVPVPVHTTGEGLDFTHELVDEWRRPSPQLGQTYLSWSKKTTYDNNVVNTIDSLFERCYEDEIRKRYSPAARNLSLTLHLNALDIQELKYSDLIMIEGTYYYIVSVSNYVVGTKEPCQVVLRKAITTLPSTFTTSNCLAFGVGSINNAGVVTFVDRSNVEIDSTEACCESFGSGQWLWNSETNTCNSGSFDPQEQNDNQLRPTLTPTISTSYGDQMLTNNSSNGDGVNQTLRYKLFAQTKSNVATQAQNAAGDKQFVVAIEGVVALDISYVARTTSTTDFGTMEFGEVDATFRVQNGRANKVASDGQVIRNGDASSVSLQVLTSNVGDLPVFEIECQGHNGTDVDWQIDVVMRLSPMFEDVPAVTTGTIITQSSAILLTQNGLTSLEIE